MDGDQVRRVRSFNRAVALSVGALNASYLERGRPLSEARLVFEIGAAGAEARALRMRLGLDSGYLSRMMQSLSSQGLVETRKDPRDGRLRRIALTRKGRAELRAYDRLSDRLAASTLEPLDARRRERLVAAMSEVERLLGATRATVDFEPPTSDAARRCLDSYFRELADRFEGGYDAAKDRSAPLSEMTPPAGRFVVARLDGDAIGCGALKRVDERGGEIKRVWVAKSARGLGVARSMLGKLEAAALEMGLMILRLDTNKALTEAHALYRVEGYREVEPFNDNPYAHHWFEKRLSPSPRLRG
ncbi:MAG TPA: helix-turn-helix domain-containing GNAT family N-acetyltransferase [Roseiarcus sp.]|jgi:DNA-binding MarR family transcriptional regulator|nr:helix-turn-helix domain-containing GNAT family N-acetyltransferase [Roseiarcus sp.]